MSVQRSQSSIARGQTAGYVVQVSTQNGSASGVSVVLTAQPSGQKPTFSSGCAKGNGSASCSIGSVTSTPASLQAQIVVASNASSVSSVTLTATASMATTVKWTPPAAAETTSVTAASANNPATSSPDDAQPPTLSLGPLPALAGATSLFIGAGNAAGLFPAITPSGGVSPMPSAVAQPSPGTTAPVSDAEPVSEDAPIFTAQVAGLIALGLAIMLTVTRLSARKRAGKRG